MKECGLSEEWASGLLLEEVDRMGGGGGGRRISVEDEQFRGWNGTKTRREGDECDKNTLRVTPWTDVPTED